MKFGVREICDVVLKKKSAGFFGQLYLDKDMPVVYFDTMKTSSLESAATTVYAQGGQGNPRLVAWEGDRTVTFTMEDALISPESFSILSGAGVMDATASKPIYIHTTEEVQVTCLKGDGTYDTATGGYLVLSHAPSPVGDFYIMLKNDDGTIRADRIPMCIPWDADMTAAEYNYHGTNSWLTNPGEGNVGYDAALHQDQNKGYVVKLNTAFGKWADKYNTDHADLIARGHIQPAVAPKGADTTAKYENGKLISPVTAANTAQIFDYVMGANAGNPGSVMYVDYYVESVGYSKQVDIEAAKFGGSYYLEASTLFRDQATGEDYPAEFIIPNCKVQSNFTFTMAPTGDPSTFTFTLDAFPDYTKFDRSKKVIAALQIIDDTLRYDNFGLTKTTTTQRPNNAIYENTGRVKDTIHRGNDGALITPGGGN